MGLINHISKGTDFGFLTALVGRLAEGIIMVTTAKTRKTRITLMKRLKAFLKDQGYDLSRMTMKFRGFDRIVFMKADRFFDSMHRYRVIYDLVAIYDEYGMEIDIKDIMEAMMFEGIFGDDDDIDGWGDFGGFSGWD